MGNTLTAGHAPWHDPNVHAPDLKQIPKNTDSRPPPLSSSTRSISKASAPYSTDEDEVKKGEEVVLPGIGTTRSQPLSLSLSALGENAERSRAELTTVVVGAGIRSSIRNLSHGDLSPNRDMPSSSSVASSGPATGHSRTRDQSMEIIVDTTHAPTRPPARHTPGSELATKMSNAQRLASTKKKEMQRVNSLMHIMDRTDQKQLSGSKTVLFTTAVREKRRRSKLENCLSGSPNSRASSARTSVETVASNFSNHDVRSEDESFIRSASFHATESQDCVVPNDERSENEILSRRRRSVAKSNSCSTLFVDSTMNKADLHGTLHCVATALLASIQKNHELASFKTNDIFSELLHPLLEDRPLSRPDRLPSEEEIYNFLESLFDAATLKAECAIITLIYIERMLSYSDLTLHACNWARVLLGGLLLACKVWDDQAVWNADFCNIFPAVQVSDMNHLERWYICAIQHNVSIKASLYAKYYFELRDVAERSHRRFELRPLSIREAQRLETRSRILTVAPNPSRSVVDTPSEHEGMRRAMSDNFFVPNTPATIM